jgi:EpsD family peptidyl-prolyl cis-trans isomerase
MQSRPVTAYRLPLTALLVLALAAGCGKSDDKKPATQVAAKVNSDEITVHQIDNVLARTPNVTPENAASARKQILERLIDQQLARQQAVAKKLDRSPAVLQALEGAKSEILARAYLESIAAAQPKPTPEETKKYYEEHPELFSKRRVFNIEEIAVEAKEGVLPDLQDQTKKARSMQEIGSWLQAKGIPFRANRGVRPAEQIPLGFLPKVQAMKDGEIQVFGPVNNLYEVIRVAESKPAPIDEKTATPFVQAFLFNQRAAEVAAKEMKEVKEKAKIEYMGDFASGAAAPSAMKPAAQTAPQPVVEKGAAAQSKAAAKADPGKTTDLPQQNIEKGVRGLR